jgi:hypothetical protein
MGKCWSTDRVLWIALWVGQLALKQELSEDEGQLWHTTGGVPPEQSVQEHLRAAELKFDVLFLTRRTYVRVDAC